MDTGRATTSTIKMARVFVPYKSENPASIEVKGHKVLIVASKVEDLIEHEYFLSSEEIREMYFRETDEETLQRLAKLVDGGVVLAPPGVGLSAMISSLEHELPWIH